MHHETSHAKAAHDYQQALVQTVGDFLQHVHMTEIQPDAATVFVHDECNPDSIGAVATACSPHVPADNRFDFQKAHITGHRVDGSSVAGRVIESNQDGITLTDSAMNPDHRVLNLPLPDQHAVLQAAFTKDRTPTKRQLDKLETLWQYNRTKTALGVGITALQALARESYPTQSVADMLALKSPTTPNVVLAMWDVSHSTKEIARDNGKLRSFIVQFGIQALTAVQHYGGELIGWTGDGQNLAVPLPRSNNARFSREQRADFGNDTLVPLLSELVDIAQAQDEYTVRLTAGFGRLDSVPGGKMSPALFGMTKLSKRQPRDQLSIALTGDAYDMLAPALPDRLRHYLYHD
jgi:hypothetical protein